MSTKEDVFEKDQVGVTSGRYSRHPTKGHLLRNPQRPPFGLFGLVIAKIQRIAGVLAQMGAFFLPFFLSFFFFFFF